MVFEVQDKASDCQSRRTRNRSDYNINGFFLLSVIQIRIKVDTNEITGPEYFTKEVKRNKELN